MQKLIIAITALLLSVSCATIYSSAEKGDITSVRNFVNDGIDVNKKDENGATSLMLAVKSNNPELVSYLIEKGADVNAKDKDGYTPIMYTKYMMWHIYVTDLANNHQTPPYSIPLDVIEEINCIDAICPTQINYQYNPQSVYWYKQKIKSEWEKFSQQEDSLLKIVKTLIDKGADLTIIAKDNDTILNYSIKFVNKEIVELLLKNGADADHFVTTHKNKKTNISQISCDGAQKLQPYIKKDQKTFCENNITCENIIPYCIDVLNDKEFIKEYSYLLLSFAIKEDDTEMIENLVKKGATLDNKKNLPQMSATVNISDNGTINVSNLVKETPVFAAVREKKIKSLNKLIELGANLNAVDHDGLTPLITAITAYKPDEEIIQTLIDNGANLNFVVNNKESEYNGMSVMDIAKKRKITIKLK